MNIIIEDNKNVIVTLKSIEENFPKASPIVVSCAEKYIEDNVENLSNPSLVLKGTSVKVVTGQLKSLVESVSKDLDSFAVGKKYPGAFAKDGYHKAYKWAGIKDPLNEYDMDVLLINPKKYLECRDDDLFKLFADKKAKFLPYTMNAKDDFLMVDLIENPMMMGRNVSMTKHAGIINLSLDCICSGRVVDTCVLYPFDILYKYTKGSDLEIAPYIEDKAVLFETMMGKIKEAKLKYE